MFADLMVFIVFECLTVVGRDLVQYGDLINCLPKPKDEIYKSRYFAIADFIFFHCCFLHCYLLWLFRGNSMDTTMHEQDVIC